MIRNYRDHAANERTYLAWVRTALALMGFGLLVERFDLLMQALAMQVPKDSNRCSTRSPNRRRNGSTAAAGNTNISMPARA